MVPTLSIVAMVFTMLISMLLALSLVIVLRIKKHISLLAVLLGALVFLVFQLLTRVPLLQLLATTPFYRQMATSPVALGLFLGFTAGLFEEVGRYVAMRFFLKGRWQIKNGVAYGLGHGGFEALALIGLTYVNNLIFSVMINNGQFATAVAPKLGAQAAVIQNALIHSAPGLFAVAGLERIFTLVIQVALSLVVLFAVRRHNLIYLVYAILLHTLVDFGAVVLVSLPSSSPIVLTEAFVFVMALAGGIYIWRTWKKYETPEEEPAALQES